MTFAKQGALFLDRDGTIIVDEHYLNDSARVKLMPGAARTIAKANSLNVPVFVVTNQSGIGRGMITEAQYAAVALRLGEMLAEHNARIDATYYCPQTPESIGPDNCRKPALLLYLQAAATHHIDLARSAYIGDKWRDIEPALKLNGYGVLIPTSATPAADIERAVLSAHTSPDIEHAVGAALTWMSVLQ
ncbi:MAG: HAD-IIIA family hydrolase [Gemmatimonadaceae bacterium]